MDRECTLAGGLEAGLAVAAGEREQTQAAPVAMLGVGSAGELLFDDLGGTGADRFGPVEEPPGRPVTVCAMRWFPDGVQGYDRLTVEQASKIRSMQ